MEISLRRLKVLIDSDFSPELRKRADLARLNMSDNEIEDCISNTLRAFNRESQGHDLFGLTVILAVCLVCEERRVSHWTVSLDELRGVTNRYFHARLRNSVLTAMWFMTEQELERLAELACKVASDPSLPREYLMTGAIFGLALTIDNIQLDDERLGRRKIAPRRIILAQ